MRRFRGKLLVEAAPLLLRIVQFSEGVGQLHLAGVELEALHRVGIVRPLLRERRDFGRKIVDEGRLDQPVLAQPLEDLGGDLAGAVAGAVRNSGLEAELALHDLHRTARLVRHEVVEGRMLRLAERVPVPALDLALDFTSTPRCASRS